MTTNILYTAFDVVPSPKGASRHITRFTRALTEAGYRVTLFTVGLEETPAGKTWAGAEIIRFHSDESNFLQRALRFGDAVWEHLRQQEGAYDIVHFRDIWSGAAALRAQQRLGYRYRTIFEANGLPSVELKYHYPAIQETALPNKLKAQEQAILRQVDAIICVSSVTATYLRSLGADERKIRVIPNGVSTDEFRPANGWHTQPPRLVYAGTLAAWQGVGTLIRAMPIIVAAYPDAELHLIGPVKKRHQKGLQKLARKVGLDEANVRFVEPVAPEEMPEKLAQAAVCLAPLNYSDRNVSQGCCPIKLLEYAAVARPIVAADLPVVRELLGEGEVRYFEPDDVTGLAQQVIHLLNHPEEAQVMGRRAAQKVRQRFTWAQAGAQLREVYAALSGGVGESANGRISE